MTKVFNLFDANYFRDRYTSPKNKGADNGYGKYVEVTRIYAIKCKAYIKIGLATNVQNRRTSMQTGNPYPVVIIDSFEVKKSIAPLVEHSVALMLDHHHHFGEWFCCSKQDALFAIKSAISKHTEEPVKIEKPQRLSQNCRVITPHGTFNSAAEAGRALNMSGQNVRFRLVNPSIFWADWRYDSNDFSFHVVKPRLEQRIITPNGTFNTVKEAAESHKISRQSVYERIKHGRMGWCRKT